jgi:mannose-6-phosphate isomerase-like protein (cupin superfamily)
LYFCAKNPPHRQAENRYRALNNDDYVKNDCMKINKSISEHYTWGQNCDGWHLLKTDTLSIIQERMPSGTSESFHFHNKSQQFFYILSGSATFEVDGKIIEVNENEGIHIKPKQEHKITNSGTLDLTFLVVSEPKSQGDRINIEL